MAIKFDEKFDEKFINKIKSKTQTLLFTKKIFFGFRYRCLTPYKNIELLKAKKALNIKKYPEQILKKYIIIV